MTHPRLLPCFLFASVFAAAVTAQGPEPKALPRWQSRILVSELLDRYAPPAEADRVSARRARRHVARGLAQCLRVWFPGDPDTPLADVWLDGNLYTHRTDRALFDRLYRILDSLNRHPPGHVQIRAEVLVVDTATWRRLEPFDRPRPLAPEDKEVLQAAASRCTLAGLFADLDGGLLRSGESVSYAQDFEPADSGARPWSIAVFTGVELGLVAMPVLAGETDGAESGSIAVACRIFDHVLQPPVSTAEVAIETGDGPRSIELQMPRVVTAASSSAFLVVDGEEMLVPGPIASGGKLVMRLTATLVPAGAALSDTPRAERGDALAPASTEPWTDEATIWKRIDDSDYDTVRDFLEDPATPGYALYYHDTRVGRWQCEEREVARALVQRFLAQPSNVADKHIRRETVHAWGFDFYSDDICYRVHRPDWFEWDDQVLLSGVGRRPEFRPVGRFTGALRNRTSLRWLAEYDIARQGTSMAGARVLTSYGEIGPGPWSIRHVVVGATLHGGDWNMDDQVEVLRSTYELNPDTGEVRARQEQLRTLTRHKR